MTSTEDKCRRWAAKHKQELYDRSKGLCERCKQTISIDEAVIHHITYKKEFDYMRIIHKKCHTIIHQLQVEKNFLKKMIKWIKMYPSNTSKKEIIILATNRLLELNNDSDIPEAKFPKNI